ncbi:hypothetical protein B0H13DRAFT_1883072 [Mycena leptocephala]|nr:hypothetical protein B0H13DRAFT_1883072 [Mycena leptocephala]
MGRYLLSGICFTLHLLLVLAHIVLLISGIKHWEHSFIFPLEHQIMVSFWTTTITQAFGTIYTSTLVFLTQKLAMQQNIRTHQTLTATHDIISSWAGFGSALAMLFNQVSVPASVLGTLSVVSYLGCIAMLHITIPAILSVETFNTTIPVPASTFGMPEFENSTTVDSTHAFMATFPSQFLPWRGVFDDSQMVGLFNSSLYEVLQKTTNEKGHAQVLATGFNISCGYLPAVLNKVDQSGWFFTFDSLGKLFTYIIGTNLVSMMPLSSSSLTPYSSIIIFFPKVVVDSEGLQGSPIILNNQSPLLQENITNWNLNISQIQFLRCSKSLVSQSGIIDTQSNNLNSPFLYPSIYKNSSRWIASMDMTFEPQDSTLLGSDVNLDPIYRPVLLPTLSSFLNISSVVQLHDIENALSSLFAMVFWIGFIRWTFTAIIHDHRTKLWGWIHFRDSPNTDHREYNNSARDILCKIELDNEDTPEDVGLLHHIWLWCKHPELSDRLRDVKEPTNIQLRITGLVPFRLLREAGTNTEEHGSPSVVDRKQLQDQDINKDNSLSLDSTHEVHLLSRSSIYPQIMFMPLHILLVMIHLLLMGLGKARKEHNVIFSIEQQQNVSFWSTVVTQAFGTIYMSILVYLTQRLAITCAIQKYSLLTTTHDKVSAWAGIGAAVSTLYRQRELPVSVCGTVLICLYLASISILHVTTPALFSVATFDLSVVSNVTTQSMPQWNDSSPHNSTIASIQNDAPFLQWLGNFDESKTLGLSNGSLYDVLTEAFPGAGTAQISALGFNITCGYIPGVTAKLVFKMSGINIYWQEYNISFPTEHLNWPGWDGVPNPDTILMANSNTNLSALELPANSITLITRNSVSDSIGELGPRVILPDSNMTMQFLRCSMSLVPQIGQVDVGSKRIVPNSLYPPIYKEHSTWQSYDTIPRTSDGTSLLEGDNILSGFGGGGLSTPSDWSLDWGSLYLMQQLGLQPLKSGHVYGQPQTYLMGGEPLDDSQHLMLASGNTIVKQSISAARLDVSIGLGASTLLLILAITFSASTRISKSCLNSLGLLQIIWVFEHHPELSGILEQVENPTDFNLRVAGLVKVRLSDAQLGQQD